MSAQNLLRAVYVFLAVLWPTLTFAAASTFGSTFEGVGFAAWMMVVVLSTVAGLTALLNRIGTELNEGSEDGHRLPKLWLFVAANLFGSWLTGLFFFLICEHFDVPDFLEAAAVIGASYVGARLIERTMEGLVDKALDKLALIFGTQPSRQEYRPSRFRDDDEDPHPGRF